MKLLKNLSPTKLVSSGNKVLAKRVSKHITVERILIAIAIYFLTCRVFKSCMCLCNKCGILKENFEATSGKKTLLFLHMNGCGHCKDFMPEWDNFAKSHSHSDTIEVAKVEKDEDPELMEKLGVAAYPTVVLVDDKLNKIKEFDGDRTAAALTSFVEENM